MIEREKRKMEEGDAPSALIVLSEFSRQYQSLINTAKALVEDGDNGDNGEAGLDCMGTDRPSASFGPSAPVLFATMHQQQQTQQQQEDIYDVDVLVVKRPHDVIQESINEYATRLFQTGEIAVQDPPFRPLDGFSTSSLEDLMKKTVHEHVTKKRRACETRRLTTTTAISSAADSQSPHTVTSTSSDANSHQERRKRYSTDEEKERRLVRRRIQAAKLKMDEFENVTDAQIHQKLVLLSALGSRARSQVVLADADELRAAGRGGWLFDDLLRQVSGEESSLDMMCGTALTEDHRSLHHRIVRPRGLHSIAYAADNGQMDMYEERQKPDPIQPSSLSKSTPSCSENQSAPRALDAVNSSNEDLDVAELLDRLLAEDSDDFLTGDVEEERTGSGASTEFPTLNKDLILVASVFYYLSWSQDADDAQAKKHSKSPCIHSQDMLIYGNQKLTALRDAIMCPSEQIYENIVSKAAFLFIENTFYNDTRDPSNDDLSRPVVEWINSNQRYASALPFAGIVDQRSMENIAFQDLSIRLHRAYLFRHCGDCDHVVVFTEVRLANANDARIPCRSFPWNLFFRPPKLQKCMVCDIYRATRVTLRDRLSPESITFFCDRCYQQLHYNANGELLYSDFDSFEFTSPAPSLKCVLTT